MGDVLLVTVTHDSRSRPPITCDCCGRLDRKWKRLELFVDGSQRVSVRVCRACETDGVDALREALRRGRVTAPFRGLSW